MGARRRGPRRIWVGRGWRSPSVAGALLVVGALIGSACGCSGSGGGDGATTTTTGAVGTSAPATVAPSTTTSVPVAQDLSPLVVDRSKWSPDQLFIIESYVRAEQAMVQADFKPVNPDDPALAATTTGAPLRQRRKILEDDIAAGRYSGRPDPETYKIWPEAFGSTTATRATFTACLTSDGPVFETSTDRQVSNDSAHVRVKVTMDREGVSWKLAGREDIARWPGIGECPSSS